MSRNNKLFAGLHLAPLPGFTFATFTGQFDGQLVETGFGGLSITDTVNIIAGSNGPIDPTGSTFGTVDLANDNGRTPDYASVLVFATATASSNEGVVGTLTHATALGTLYYPYGVTETNELGTQTFNPSSRPPGTFESRTGLATFMRRNPDGDTYTGDPTNDGVDVLIPWAEFLSDPTLQIDVAVTAGDADQRLSTLESGGGNDIVVVIRPYYLDVVPGGWMCVL